MYKKIAEANHQYGSTLIISAQYNYIDGSFDGGVFDGNKIPFVAEHNLTFNARYIINNNWSTTAETRYTGSRHQAGDYGNVFDKLPSFTTVNAQISYQQKNWTASLRINNLTDESYASYALFDSFYPAPERNAMAKIRYEF